MAIIPIAAICPPREGLAEQLVGADGDDRGDDARDRQHERHRQPGQGEMKLQGLCHRFVIGWRRSDLKATSLRPSACGKNPSRPIFLYLRIDSL
jgi:hypothetical protein